MFFEDWHEKAGVRTQARHHFSGCLKGYLPFPASSLPEMSHPAVLVLEPEIQNRLLVQYLYRFLRATVHLETRVVNRALTRLATEDVEMCVSDHIRKDALKILTDESFHALASMDMMRQVVTETSVSPLAYNFEPTLDRLDVPVPNPPAGYDRVRHLLQASVFETMIAAILDKLPIDTAVHPAIRELAADHVADERVHHAFFFRFFPELWSALDPAIRRVAARDIPGVINTCLAPDLDYARRALIDSGLDHDIAESIIRDCYAPDVVAQATRKTARSTIRLMQDTGVMDSADSLDAFMAAGLIVQ
jgi:para-aminobenzoate N-oxygenase AurF